ncbi:MAG: tRNA 2-thiouridine(34) synthase MnmA [Eubacterium sp.]|nr:tRNA 2-thiouridine(34) synthase MnmA [Eubacterium sp.]
MKKVVVGMSGGVDSAAASLLLQRAGYEVIGVRIRTQASERTEKEYDQEESDAGKCAAALGIPFYVLDCSECFHREVEEPFIQEYLKGRTPSPCTRCNHSMKWKGLMEAAERFGADHVATGHYAEIIRPDNGRYTVKASETGKDQSYMLYRLSQEQLSKTLFPLGKLEKPEIRRIAEEAGIPVFSKPDSQELCFVPDGDYAAFIKKQKPEEMPGPGYFVDKQGNILGTHKGIVSYTTGQRRGLGLPGKERFYVTEIRADRNEVVIGCLEDMYHSVVYCRDLHFMGIPDLSAGEELRAVVKIRYRHPGEAARIIREGEDLLRIEFENPVRSATPGQSAVFYKDGYILGGGVIDRVADPAG